MAKNKETKAANEVILTEDNIVNHLEEQNRLTTALSKKTLEEFSNEMDENVRREAKQRFYKATYQSDLALLQRRAEKKKFDVALFKIRQAGRLVRFLMGFTFDEKVKEYNKTPDEIWSREKYNEKDNTLEVVINKKTNEKKTFKLGEEVPAIIDSVDYDQMKRELDENMKKKYAAIDDEHNTNIRKLELAYGEYYNSSWRW